MESLGGVLTPTSFTAAVDKACCAPIHLPADMCGRRTDCVLSITIKGLAGWMYLQCQEMSMDLNRDLFSSLEVIFPV
jgi:hypothetical protein